MNKDILDEGWSDLYHTLYQICIIPIFCHSHPLSSTLYPTAFLRPVPKMYWTTRPSYIILHPNRLYQQVSIQHCVLPAHGHRSHVLSIYWHPVPTGDRRVSQLHHRPYRIIDHVVLHPYSYTQLCITPNSRLHPSIRSTKSTSTYPRSPNTTSLGTCGTLRSGDQCIHSFKSYRFHIAPFPLSHSPIDLCRSSPYTSTSLTVSLLTITIFKRDHRPSSTFDTIPYVFCRYCISNPKSHKKRKETDSKSGYRRRGI